MLRNLFKAMAPVAAIAISAAVSGCDGMNVNINGSDGVPLAELDMSAAPPEGVVLAGPDHVIVTDGDAFSIDVDGEAADKVRFTLDDETLGVLRESDNWSSDNGIATIRVTMPSPKSLTIAGSGTLEAASLSGEAQVNVLGSGEVSVARIDASKLDLNIAGAGKFTGAGASEALKANVVGSGKGDLAGLKVDTAKLTIAGSGDLAFASDGKVDAKVMGSGNVTVIGRATCKVDSMGSGNLTCRAADAAPDQAKAESKGTKKTKKADKKV